jgi:hypothetical protein
MEELLNQDALNFFAGMQTRLSVYWEDYIGDATALCAIFMLLYFALKSYEMMLGKSRLDLLPLFRPFALLLVVLYWSQFVSIVSFPGELIAHKAKARYEANVSVIDAKALERRKLINEALMRINTTAGEVKETKELSDNWAVRMAQEAGNAVVDAVGAVKDKLFSSFALIKAEISFWMGKIVEFLALCFFRLCVYLIMFIQIIFSSILIILGPFAFAMSILPAFRDSYTAWIARFISVSLYTGIAYIILNIVMAMLAFTMDQEIQRLTFLLKPDHTNEFMAWAAASPGLLGYYLVGLLLGGVCLLTVPSISTWVVASSGINSAVGVAGRAASAAVSGGVSGGKAMVG